MLSIPYTGTLSDRNCPVCPELVTLRRAIDPASFACRYWVECPSHGIITDLSTWLDQDFRPVAEVAA